MAITHADSKTDNVIPDIVEDIPEIKDEIKKPNTKEEVDLEKADKPVDLWETFLERRKMQGAGDARYGNVHETGMEQNPVDDDFCLCVDEGESDKTYIPKKGKEINDDDK
jgi:hypothetical protein